MKITFKVASEKSSSKPILTIEENNNSLEILPGLSSTNPLIHSSHSSSHNSHSSPLPQSNFKKPKTTLYYPLHEMKAQMKEFFYKRTGKKQEFEFPANSSPGQIQLSFYTWELYLLITFARAFML